MKRIIILLVSLLVTSKVSAQQEAIQSAQLSAFHTIVLSGNMNVQLIKSDQNVLKEYLVSATVEKLKWHVNNDGALHVTVRPTSGVETHADVRIYYNDVLQRISVTESNVATENSIEAPMLVVDITGGGNAKLAVKCKDLEVNSSGNSAATLVGATKYLTIKASQHSGIDARNLQSESADVSANMGAELFVNANDRLAGSAVSGATIWHVGTPDILKSHTRLGGKIYAIDPASPITIRSKR